MLWVGMVTRALSDHSYPYVFLTLGPIPIKEINHEA